MGLASALLRCRNRHLAPGKNSFRINRSSVREAKEFRAPYDALAEQVLADAEANANSDAKADHPRVFIISQHEGGWDYYTLRYCLRPCDSTGWTLAQEGSEEGMLLISLEEWKEQLKEYDYVVIYRLDEPFVEQYGSLFANYTDYSDPVTERTAYIVDHGRDKLVKLGTETEEILEDPLQYKLGQTLLFTGPETAPTQLMASGFSRPEEGFTWSNGMETVITLKPDVSEGTDLVATLTYRHVNGFQWCEIEAGNQWVFGDELPEGPNELTFTIPASAIDEDGILTIRFHFPNACEPGNGDIRQLAVAFESLKIEAKRVE